MEENWKHYYLYTLNIVVYIQTKLNIGHHFNIFHLNLYLMFIYYCHKLQTELKCNIIYVTRRRDSNILNKTRSIIKECECLSNTRRKLMR